MRLWSTEYLEEFHPMVLLEHRSPVCAAYFSEDLHYVYSLWLGSADVARVFPLRSKDGTLAAWRA